MGMICSGRRSKAKRNKKSQKKGELTHELATCRAKSQQGIEGNKEKKTPEQVRPTEYFDGGSRSKVEWTAKIRGFSTS